MYRGMTQRDRCTTVRIVGTWRRVAAEGGCRMRLYNRAWTRRQIEERLSRTEQVFGVERFELSEGAESGTEMVRIRTGAGLSYNVSLSRGMDISLAEYFGVPISWQSGNGDVHPSYYNVFQKEWLRTVAGGLLFTCGLSQVGAPCEDNGTYYGQHGRIHHIPARLVSVQGRWHGDEYNMSVTGQMDETSLFGEHLRMTREITSTAGQNRIVIKDTVENLGFATHQHMILYHFNFGFPFVDENTVVLSPSTEVRPQEPHMTLTDYEKWQAPVAGFEQRVYYHTMEHDSTVKVEILNPKFPASTGGDGTPVKVTVTWPTRHLPNLVHWKLPRAGTYVLGIEPSNCLVEGRIVEREQGTPVYLEPGQAITYEVEFAIE